ncbi:asparaginase [Deefgea salmonis]|uniref:Asparaginase n=1 Tax=Deefgea salmonis TaxID=2875502 RepID=A0ABS8BJA7_9NEIS|nr:asparaginase [Deefgea salmonis]MCB5195788.1 asparaginase [Deefgea salmonis]
MPAQHKAPQRILCLYTGGTIGCAPTPLGLAPKAGILRPVITDLLTQENNLGITLTLREYAEVLDSSSMQPADWLRIAQDIDAAYHQFDGFIILHGTDTLAWTAAALHWQLSQIDKPVVITGSQRPWLEMGSDAPANFQRALDAVQSQRHAVMVAFDDLLLPAYAVKKIDADADAAFAAPNWQGEWPRIKPGEYQFCPLDPNLNILSIKLYPGCETWLASSINTQVFAAIAIETYGSGNIPDHFLLKSALKNAVQANSLIINCSQCIRGEVRQGHYAAGSFLQEINALAAGRLTIEAATTWLYTALAKKTDHDSLRQAWQTAAHMV